MGWLDKLFGSKKAHLKDEEPAEDFGFVELKDASKLKEDATNWIRAQSKPPNTLLWFTLPFRKNQYYQPCFGVLADPVLWGKLDRANSFNIACVPGSSISSFRWGVIFEDPDNIGSLINLVTDPINADQSSLARLQYLAENVVVYYFFYASKVSSNFVWFEMGPEFKDKLYDFYASLRNSHPSSSRLSTKAEKENER